MSVSRKLRFDVFNRDDFTCKYCGRKTPEVILEIDLVIPLSKGGADDMDNLITSCFECNRGKGDSILDTILKDRDIHQETILLAEKEFQLAEYNHLKKKVRERENKEIEDLKNHFVGRFPNTSTGYAEREFPDSLIRRCLKIMSYIDIFELIDSAVEITSRDSKGDYHNVAAGKYLSGILKNKLREQPEITGTPAVTK